MANPAQRRISRCTVARLAMEFDALLHAYDQLDCEQSTNGYPGSNQSLMDVASHRKDAIKWEASYLTAKSVMGAAFQIMLANTIIDEIGDEGGYIQRQREGMAERLLRQATKYFMTGEKRISRTYQYCMGGTADPAFKLATLIRKGTQQGGRASA